MNDSTWEELVLKSSVPVLVDFWAPWCGPCRMIAPIIDELAQEYGDKIRAVRMWLACLRSLGRWEFLPAAALLGKSLIYLSTLSLAGEAEH